MRSTIHFWSGNATVGAVIVCLWLWVVADTDAAIRSAIIFTALTAITAAIWILSFARPVIDPDGQTPHGGHDRY